MFREFAATRERNEAQHDRDVTLAYNIAALTRGTKGLPRLETLLTKKPGRGRQSRAEQVAMWQVAAARFGGSFRPFDRSKVRIRGR